MPLYEYQCRACGHEFEFLRLPHDTAAPVCPACQSTDLERLLSGFAVSSEQLSSARVEARRKQIRGSKDTRDKQVAQAEYEKHHREDH